ncbi:MAG: hypothetical protein EOP38_21590 [Rubrivivax sp.]|nr:MAG: hypothetical protein EOP38_21590 [Rubrivivax sp.]
MNESEIRQAIIAKVAATKAGRGASFISEMFLDNFARRADLIVANGKLAAYEIKTARDSLERLDGQLATYLKLFEQVTVVCDARHVSGVLEATSPQVGIWSISNFGEIQVIRASKSRSLYGIGPWLSFLPVDELRAFARLRGMKATGSRADLLEALQCVPTGPARAFVLAYLKRRHQRIQAIQEKRQSTHVVARVDTQERIARLMGYSQGLGATKAIPRTVCS